MKRILFHKYELLKPLGEGSTGRVYLANDLHLNRRVAIKESIGNIVGAGEYEKEAELLKNLHHPGLPEIYDYFRQEGAIYLVMEYVEGVSLREYLDRNKRVEQKQAVCWALELTEILKYLHSCRPAIIYRDLKPGNIIVCPDGRLRLIDLGAAVRHACGQERELFCVGTPGYCPMTQQMAGEIDASWDVYGVAAILHEMLTGVNPTLPPFERRPIREYDSSFPPGLESLIQACMAEGETEKRRFFKKYTGNSAYRTMEQLEKGLMGYTEKEWKRRLWWRLRQSLVYGMGLLSCGWLFIPLLRGVEESRFPFPFLYQPILGFFLCILFYKILLQKKKGKSHMKKLEKSICLTEKRYPGLYLLLAVCGIGGMLYGSKMLWEKAEWTEPVLEKHLVYAGEGQALWVEMRDDQYRKLLLQEGSVYETDTQVRFELPVSRMPEGKLSLQIIAVGEEGEVYTSRVFLLRKKECAGD